jgi:hypothetical protein
MKLLVTSKCLLFFSELHSPNNERTGSPPNITLCGIIRSFLIQFVVAGNDNSWSLVREMVLLWYMPYDFVPRQRSMESRQNLTKPISQLISYPPCLKNLTLNHSLWFSKLEKYLKDYFEASMDVAKCSMGVARYGGNKLCWSTTVVT